MSIQSLPKRLDESTKEVASFLAPRKPNDKMEIFKGLQTHLEQAFDEPDTRRPAGRSEPPRPQREEPGPGEQREGPARTETRQLPEEDEISIQTKPKTTSANKRMVEKTFSIDKLQYKQLVRFSNLEGLRLEANVATSEILRHLLDFALAHADHEKGEILPTADGRGLRIPDRRKPQ